MYTMYCSDYEQVLYGHHDEITCTAVHTGTSPPPCECVYNVPGRPIHIFVVSTSIGGIVGQVHVSVLYAVSVVLTHHEQALASLQPLRRTGIACFTR